MKYECLELNRLAKSGEVLKTVRCFAGRVTVFRARTAAGLEPYTDVLSGQPSKKRFTVLLDGSSYEPQEHNLIGFGESFADSERSAFEFLSAAGADEESIESLLLESGLGGISAVRCAELSPSEIHRLRLLAATFSTDRVLVLKDPFMPVPEQWREAFAERLVDYAWKTRAIVIVASLSHRPEAWIDNELVSRIQVDETRRSATIGFGRSDPELVEAISQVREAYSSSGMRNKTHPEAANPNRLTAGGHRVGEKRRKDGRSSSHVLAATIVLVVASAFFFHGKRINSASETATTVTQNSPVSRPEVSSETTVAQTPVAQTTKQAPAREPHASATEFTQQGTKESPEPAQSSSPMVLAMYPRDVQQAIIRAHKGQTLPKKANQRGSQRAGRNNNLTRKNRSAGYDQAATPGEKVFSALRTENSYPAGNVHSVEHTEEEKSRREAIRQKFLDAIQQSVDAADGLEYGSSGW